MGVWDAPSPKIFDREDVVYSDAFLLVVETFIWLVNQSGYYLSKWVTSVTKGFIPSTSSDYYLLCSSKKLSLCPCYWGGEHRDRSRILASLHVFLPNQASLEVLMLCAAHWDLTAWNQQSSSKNLVLIFIYVIILPMKKWNGFWNGLVSSEYVVWNSIDLSILS